MEGLATQMRELQERGEKIIRLDLLAKKHEFSKRQKLAMQYATANGGLTIQDFEGYCKGTSRRTLQRELKELVDKGLLIPEGATNRLYYRLGKIAGSTNDKLAT